MQQETLFSIEKTLMQMGWQQDEARMAAPMVRGFAWAAEANAIEIVWHSRATLEQIAEVMA